MQLYRAALGIIVVLATLSACAQSSALIIEEFVKKLDEYATGVRLLSGVTKDDLIAVVDEWDAQPADVTAKALEIPQYKLLYHFGIVPTKRIRDQLDNIIVSIAHIHRFERAYKRFRPAYLGASIENSETGNLKMRKLRVVFNKLLAHEACTLKEFQLVDSEHSGWIARYEDIVAHEDVYANLDEMRNILNYHNGDLVKPLYDYVLPQLGKINDPAALQQLYYDKLYETSKLRVTQQGKVVRDP